jgi:hypothetical protein
LTSTVAEKLLLRRIGAALLTMFAVVSAINLVSQLVKGFGIAFTWVWFGD